MKMTEKPTKQKCTATSESLKQDLLNVTEAQRKTEMDSLRIKNHTKIFASMCPDEILDYYDNFSTRSYYTALMLGDVSGFTEMAEKYTKFGKGGPSKITETLNMYIGAMVQEILSHKGDVLKFSGDAFIVMWKLEEGRLMRDIVTDAIKTACIIQKYFGTYEITEVDIVLKVKLAISSGKIYFTSIGNPAKVTYYVITGQPVFDVKSAQGMCRGGEIIVTSSCWQWINLNEYIYEMLPDGIHILIISTSLLWDDEKDEYSDNNSSISSAESILESTPIITTDLSKNKNTLYEPLLFYRLSISNISEDPEDYSLRPKVIKAVQAKLKMELQSYMFRPVIRSVDLNEPLEYLTEIRQVVIVFVNIITEDLNRKLLIKFIDSTFLFVCGVVGDMQGCVNKMSLFDKDLTYLCIFGLRGDKHEFESQVGLRCASKLRRGLLNFSNTKSISIAVTTGMAYCGVVGHVLRREYTVIGASVNKAARLMCTYIDKVVCDRESFLLSHLEAKHFILQEPKILKGIINVGPVYEFSEQTIFSDYEVTISKYPLLGCNVEIKMFINMLTNIMDVSQNEETVKKTNILIIRGEPRMGKTRLLEEMTFMVPDNIPVNFISLCFYDNQISYILLRLIFYIRLEISDVSPIREKEEKLLSHINESNKQYLWLLNYIFNVNFKVESDENFNNDMKMKYTKKLLKKLASSCFENLWIIFIDDAELADEESLLLLHKIAQYGNIFLILSFGNKLSNHYLIPDTIVNNAKNLNLEGLNKWYHAALACHVLDVVAIPAELEKIIQERSSGNPGWIESFLISLLQSSAIVIEQYTSLEILNTGLVAPRAKMLTRSLDSQNSGSTAECSKLHTNWEMYESSFNENIMESDDMKKYDNVTKYNVCLITSNLILEDIFTETTMDSILLNLFDSLTPLDQLLLKCASILGEIVDRVMLERLMQGISERDIGLSISKLFELRIIGCAVEDFNKSPKSEIIFKRFTNTNINVEIRCGCKGSKASEALSDLPNYASCSSMRFKLSMFRETTYRLLTENQKVEFHSQALRYLQNNTHRCLSCGGGNFNTLLGDLSTNEGCKKKKGDSIDNTSLDLEEITQNENVLCANFFGFKCRSKWFQIHSLDFNSLMRTFSNVDFSNCECNLHLLTAYTHILEHCRGIGDSEILLVAILEFVEVCLSTFNIPQAMKLLREGDKLIDTIYHLNKDELIVLPYLKGKIQTLRGRCFLESGLIMDAMECFRTTMNIMKYKFPANSISITLKSFSLLLEQRLMFSCLKNLKVGILNNDSANYNNQFASCLAQMFIVYRLKGMQDHAKVAAIWGLNAALQSNNNFFVLCTAFGNMIIIAHNSQYKSIIPHLERSAINLCNQRNNAIEFEELSAVAKLYMQIFFSRWIRGMINSASIVGLISIRLARTIRSINLKLMILPRLIQLLIMEYKYDIAIVMLQELEFIAQCDMDQSGRTWYYSLCIDLLLESGLSIVSPEECEQFYKQEISSITNIRDTEAARRLYVSMWLWYLRTDNWENATAWKNRKHYDPTFYEFTVPAALSELKNLEGLIINYVYKLNNRYSTGADKILAQIKKKFKIINNFKNIVISIYPRFLLMKAYYNMVRFRIKNGMALLRKSKNVSEKLGNLLIYNWANHCEKSWMGSLSLIQQDFWKNTCTGKKLIDWHEVSTKNLKFLPYTLPLPRELNYI